MLNIEHHDYFSLHARQAGLKVLIHHHETPPIVDQLGFAVGPGVSTFAAIKKEKVRNRPFQLEDFFKSQFRPRDVLEIIVQLFPGSLSVLATVPEFFAKS